MLKSIKIKNCPICGCNKIKKELKENQHTNGFWNEYRKFECGYETYFSPNFMLESETNKCKFDPDENRKYQKRKFIGNKIIKLMKNKKMNENDLRFFQRIEDELKILCRNW